MSRCINSITVEEFIELVKMAQEIHIEKLEPIPNFQETKLNELESSLNTPFMGFNGILFYPGFLKKAAILFYLLARNHVLGNGNKRTACLCLDYFCFKNKRQLTLSEDSLYQLAKFTVIAKEEDQNKTLYYIETLLRKNNKWIKMNKIIGIEK